MVDAADMTRDEVEEVEATAPPATDPKTGIALIGDYPANHRLRAEALSKAGEEEDPDNIVSAELIKDAGERLDRDAAAEEAARPPVSPSMGREALDRIATNEGLDPSTATDKAAVVAMIEDSRAGGSAGRASADPLPPPPPPPAPGATDTKEA